jgi:cytochrome bd-type quinol oxidase subunit 2
MITPTTMNNNRTAIVDAQERTSTRRFLVAIAVLAVLAVVLAAAWVWRFHLELDLG